MLARMRLTGVDVCIDVHGDEALPYVFLAGGEGAPRWDQAMATRKQAFLDAYMRANPDMQVGILVSGSSRTNTTHSTGLERGEKKPARSETPLP